MDYNEQMTGDSGFYSRQQQESLFLSKTSKPASASYWIGIGSSFLGIKWLERETDHSRPSVEVTNAWMCTITPSFTYLHGEVLLIQYRDMCAFFVCVRRSAYESESYRPTFALRRHAPCAAEEKQQNVRRSQTDSKDVRWQENTSFLL